MMKQHTIIHKGLRRAAAWAASLCLLAQLAPVGLAAQSSSALAPPTPAASISRETMSSSNSEAVSSGNEIATFGLGGPAGAASWSGMGTQNDPYLIQTDTDLAELAATVNAGTDHANAYFRLEADGLTAATAIGSNRAPFQGHFDGQNRTITLDINAPGESYQGLFGFVGPAGVVENTAVAGVVTGQNYVGGVAGASQGTVQQCTSSAVVTGQGYGVGGITGGNSGTLQYCHNTGKVTGESANVGGVAGLSNVIGTVRYCANSADVTENNPNAGSIVNVGGVIGRFEGTAEHCYNTGAVTGQGQNVGGVIGRLEGTLQHCYNTGTVTGLNDAVGGLVGAGYGQTDTIQGCLSLGVSAAGLGPAGVGRVTGYAHNAGYVLDITLIGNQAREDMLTGVPTALDWPDTDLGADKANGGNVALGTAQSVVFGGWERSIWNIPGAALDVGGALPTLKGLPGAQNPTLPQGRMPDTSWSNDGGASWRHGSLDKGLAWAHGAADATQCILRLNNDITAATSMTVAAGKFTFDLNGSTLTLLDDACVLFQGAGTAVTLTGKAGSAVQNLLAQDASAGSGVIQVADGAKLTVKGEAAIHGPAQKEAGTAFTSFSPTLRVGEQGTVVLAGKAAADHAAAQETVAVDGTGAQLTVTENAAVSCSDGQAAIAMYEGAVEISGSARVACSVPTRAAVSSCALSPSASRLTVKDAATLTGVILDSNDTAEISGGTLAQGLSLGAGAGAVTLSGGRYGNGSQGNSITIIKANTTLADLLQDGYELRYTAAGGGTGHIDLAQTKVAGEVEVVAVQAVTTTTPLPGGAVSTASPQTLTAPGAAPSSSEAPESVTQDAGSQTSAPVGGGSGTDSSEPPGSMSSSSAASAAPTQNGAAGLPLAWLWAAAGLIATALVALLVLRAKKKR